MRNRARVCLFIGGDLSRTTRPARAWPVIITRPAPRARSHLCNSPGCGPFQAKPARSVAVCRKRRSAATANAKRRTSGLLIVVAFLESIDVRLERRQTNDYYNDTHVPLLASCPPPMPGDVPRPRPCVWCRLESYPEQSDEAGGPTDARVSM